MSLPEKTQMSGIILKTIICSCAFQASCIPQNMPSQNQAIPTYQPNLPEQQNVPVLVQQNTSNDPWISILQKNADNNAKLRKQIADMIPTPEEMEKNKKKFEKLPPAEQQRILNESQRNMQMMQIMYQQQRNQNQFWQNQKAIDDVNYQWYDRTFGPR